MLDRTLAPPFVRSTSFDLIKPLKKILSGGAEMYFVLGGSQNVCKIEVIFPAGRWNETVWGASYFCSQLLSKGTRLKSSYQIAQLFDHYGSHVEVNPGLDHVSVSLYSLNKNVEASLTLLMEMLRESVFPEKELSQLQSIYLQNHRVNKEKTSFQSSVLFRKKLYGSVHPYGKELEEREVHSLAVPHLIEHFEKHFKQATIIVSGNVSEEHQKFMADILSPFAFHSLNLPSEVAPSPVIADRQIVNKEGSVQSSIRMGKRSIGRNHADYPAVIFLNHILGGYFGSRLMKNIREDKGLSYGISSSISTMLHGNHMVIGSDVNLENLDLTFTEIRNELKRLRTEKVGSAELETARNHFIGGLQLEITTSFAHADKIRNILLFDLKHSFYTDMISRIDRITSANLLDIAESYFKEDSFVEVAVG